MSKDDQLRRAEAAREAVYERWRDLLHRRLLAARGWDGVHGEQPTAGYHWGERYERAREAQEAYDQAMGRVVVYGGNPEWLIW